MSPELITSHYLNFALNSSCYKYYHKLKRYPDYKWKFKYNTWRLSKIYEIRWFFLKLRIEDEIKLQKKKFKDEKNFSQHSKNFIFRFAYNNNIYWSGRIFMHIHIYLAHYLVQCWTMCAVWENS